MNPRTRSLIDNAVNRATQKHPTFLQDGEGLEKVVCLLMEELGEFAQAVNDGNTRNAYNEIADLIAVAVRALEY